MVWARRCGGVFALLAISAVLSLGGCQWLAAYGSAPSTAADGGTPDVLASDGAGITADGGSAAPDAVIVYDSGYQLVLTLETTRGPGELFDPSTVKTGEPLRWVVGEYLVYDGISVAYDTFPTNDKKQVLVLSADGVEGITRFSSSEDALVGPVPRGVGRLRSLQILTFSKNALTGQIPAELGQLDQLTYLALHDNQLTGPIPAALGKLTALEELYLRSNQLSGSIPPELGNLHSLKKLVLWSNQLSGSIPASLGQLENLSQLLLNANQLSGYEQGAFSGLTATTSINLYNNLLPQSAVDALVADLYADRDARPEGAAMTLNLGGTNQAPGSEACRQLAELRDNYGWVITLDSGDCGWP